VPKCHHCLLEFPDRDAVYDEIEGRQTVFCCRGCNGIYRLIHDEGLGTFYEKRHWKDAGIPESLRETQRDMGPFAEYVRDADGQKEIDLYIDGIRCASCVWLNEKILSRTEGVEYARVNYATHRARIRWRPETTGLEEILTRILSIGYDPKPYSESERFRLHRAETRDLLVRFGTAAFLSSQLMIYSIALYAGYFEGIDPGTKTILECIAMLLTLPVICYSGMPLIRGMLRGLAHLHFTMDSLVVIGSGSAFFYSISEMFSGGQVYFDTSAMIITLILLGRYIEAGAKGKASETIERLAELAPKSATRIIGRGPSDGGGRETITVSSLDIGDCVEVKPGERIPLDGTVIRGESEVDESLLTGESKPVPKGPGAGVIGGSVNRFGTLVFEVKKKKEDGVLAGIIKAVEDAQSRKPKIQALADRTVGIFVPAILTLALATVLLYLAHGSSLRQSLMTGISVLVIACPCSLGLATPIAVLIFASAASSRGVLIKSGDVIENASRVTRVLFDKTGTITLGKATMKETVVIDHSHERDELMELAASLECMSEHSIGRTICGAARHVFAVSGFRATPGKGVEGTVEGKKIFIGNLAFLRENGIAIERSGDGVNAAVETERFAREGDTVVTMGWDGKARALLVVSDAVRTEAPETVAVLKKSGYDVEIVSGDNEKTTKSIASRVGVDLTLADASPTGKKDRIAALQAAGRSVMMVGDGINDAPGLTEAAVGVAMGRGTDIAMESADAVLLRNDLRLIPYFFGLSRKTFRIIRQNIFWAFFYNSIAVPLAVAGLLHPIIAAGAMATSSLFVVGNSMRIRE
jgi:P-type Cu2+ transporter